MLVFKTTKKEVVESFNKVLCVPYGGALSLLGVQTRRAYTAGTYGWEADVYDFGGVAVVTGYAPFGDPVDPDRLKYYDDLAWAADAAGRNECLREWLRAECGVHVVSTVQKYVGGAEL